MGKQYKQLTDKDREFIENQKLFFIASSSNAEVNLSPKGYECLKVLSPSKVLYADYPGSGNRTARDISNDGEITIMFNAFEGEANIVRLFCKGTVVTKDNKLFNEYVKEFDIDENVIRQFFIFDIYAVESSCGMSVPNMRYESERKDIKNWAKTMLKNDKLEAYIDDHHTPVDLKKI
jgi:hypothetical protein